MLSFAAAQALVATAVHMALALYVWRHKPPFGQIQFAFQRGRAEFGERSEQGNTFFVKMSHVF